MSATNAIDLNYFAMITDVQINKDLAFLKQNLPRKCTRKNYQLTYAMLGVKNQKVNRDNLQDVLQGVADKMRQHLQIERPIKILTTNVEGGKFERIADLNCIFVNDGLDTQNFQQKVAILAHEMSHYYLIYQRGIHLPKVEENELLTELNTIYCGFGLLLLEGYRLFEEKRGNQLLKSKVGYINTRVVRRTMIKTAYLRKQNPVWILKNVGIGNFITFTIGLFPLLKDYYYARKKP